ncbi:MAG: FAD-binding domain-containing protein [Gemmataceae bacterium]
MDFHPSRISGLERLNNFLPRAGRQYADTRNHDYGPEDRTNVSVLSPYISRRLITEGEVVQQVLTQHSANAAEKFIQEVLWRTYWKGWLEMRPSVWLDYLTTLQKDCERMEKFADSRSQYAQAVAGETGIDCFDEWSRELVENGYLHNHARMWFASIWIFTLNLPWTLGADFFYRHLLDADPASNTLSWRWVAGLQTKGKNYTATASNIRKFTNGRFHPGHQLANNPEPLHEDNEYPRGPYDPGQNLFRNTDEYGLLVFQEDLTPELSELQSYKFKAAAGCGMKWVAEQYDLAQSVRDFSDQAMLDCQKRVQEHFGISFELLEGNDPAAEVVDWCQREQLAGVVTLKPCQGPWREVAFQINASLKQANLDTTEVRRNWDKELHPHARAGYFGFKKQIPKTLRTLDTLVPN